MEQYSVESSLDWRRFSECYWDRKPVIFKGTSRSPFSQTEVFHAAVQAGRHATTEQDQTAPTVRFTLGRRQKNQIQSWVPLTSDQSFRGYEERMLQSGDTARYALIVNRLHHFSFPLWQSEGSFFSGLWEQVGLPLSGAITTLFHGNYEHTPVGVHKDRFSTFLFALHGSKRMRFWTERPWHQPVATRLDYSEYLDSSFVVDVEPGDILYWPASYYHVGESSGTSPSTSVNVGIPRTEHKVNYDFEHFLNSPEDQSGSHDAEVFFPVSSSGEVEFELPSALSQVLFGYRSVLTSEDLHTDAGLGSLKHQSTNGLNPAPVPGRHRQLTDADCVQADPLKPILWAHGKRGDILCAANGHALRISEASVELVNLFARLNMGDVLSVRDLLAPFPPGAGSVSEVRESITASRDGMRYLLEALVSFRALEHVVPASRKR